MPCDEKWLESEYTLEVELTEYVNRLGVGMRKKEVSKMTAEFLRYAIEEQSLYLLR